MMVLILTMIGCMAMGLITVAWYYQLRNQGSIGQPIRFIYKVFCYFYMPFFLLIGTLCLVKGVTLGYVFFIAPIPFYVGVVIMLYLMNKEYKKA